MDSNIHSILAGYLSNFGLIEWEWIIKVCIDISYQVMAIEVAETCSEEAAITDTLPALISQYSIPACG